MHKFKIEAIKFTLVGIANFVITFIVFTVLLKLFKVDYSLSLVAAWIAGLLFSYIFHFIFVFKVDQKIQFRANFFRYFLAGALSISLNVLFLKALVINTGFDPFYVQIFLVPFVVVFNFSTSKYWSFK